MFSFILISLVIMVLFALIILFLDNRHIKKSLLMKDQMIGNLQNSVLAQNNLVSTLSRDVSNSLGSSTRVLGLVSNMADKYNDSLKQVAQDHDRMIEMIKVLTEAQQKSILTHNELVNFTMDQLSDIWCDLCEDDCSCCPFEQICKNYNPDDPSNSLSGIGVSEDGTPFSPETIVSSDYNGRGATGSMVIDPESESDMNQLFDEMRKSGLPEEVVKQYSVAIKDLLKKNPNHPKKIDIKWHTEDVSNFKPFVKKSNVPPPTREDKLVDPKSKIVKSLNKLFDDSK